MLCILAADCEDIKTLLNKTNIIKKYNCGISNVFLCYRKGHKYLIATTGYGKVNIGTTLGQLLSKYDIDKIIGVGNCASLCQDYAKLGSIAISICSLQYDVDFQALGCPPTILPNFNIGTYPCNKNLVKLARQSCAKCGYHSAAGLFISADKFISNTNAANHLKDTFNGNFLDVECGNIGQIACMYNIPYVCVKGISNYANNSASTCYDENESQANAKACNVVNCMLNELTCTYNY